MRPVLLWLCFVVVLPGCGGGTLDTSGDETAPAQSSPQEPVSDFFKRQFEYQLWGKHEDAWQELHPGQQALVPRGQFVRCAQRTNPDIYPSLEVRSVNVLSMYSEDEPPPIGVADETLAVTMEVTIVDPGIRKDTSTESLHTATVDGRFVWMLPSEAVRAFQK